MPRDFVSLGATNTIQQFLSANKALDCDDRECSKTILLKVDSIVIGGFNSAKIPYNSDLTVG